MRNQVQGRGVFGLLLSILAASAVLAACSSGTYPPKDSDADSVTDAQDCAPQDATKWQTLTYQSVDMEGDGHRVGVPAGSAICTGNALPARYFADPPDPDDIDCDDTNASVWKNLTYAGADADADGHFVASSGQLCTNGNLPEHYSATAPDLAAADCDDTNNIHWQLLPYTAADEDADGHFIVKSGQACSGNTLATGYAVMTPDPMTVDCDDANETIWRLVMTYRDADHDGVGAGTGHVTCEGTKASSGFSFLGYDPIDDPSDPVATSVSNLELAPWQLTVP